MPTPRLGYYIDGERVPSVSSILSRFKESGGLIAWAWKLGTQGIDYRQVRDAAADAGTCAHDMMDCFIHKRDFDASKYKPELVELARPAFEAFMQWAAQSHFVLVETEVQLVSRKYRFGGTRDTILIDGKRALGDFKTSNRIYPEYLCQLAAYGILDEEAGNVIDGGYHLLKFSKQERPDDPVRFSHFYWSQLDLAKEAFILMRQLYDCMKRLEGMAR
jgi:hypothetical protein